MSFSTFKRIKERTGKYGIERSQYFKDLISEFQVIDSKGKFIFNNLILIKGLKLYSFFLIQKLKKKYFHI